jgi:hypothetical protein
MIRRLNIILKTLNYTSGPSVASEHSPDSSALPAQFAPASKPACRPGSGSHSPRFHLEALSGRNGIQLCFDNLYSVFILSIIIALFFSTPVHALNVALFRDRRNQPFNFCLSESDFSTPVPSCMVLFASLAQVDFSATLVLE